MHSPNFVEDNIAKLAALFPGCVTESTDEDGNTKKVIDFDLLRQELANSIVEGPQEDQERYHLNWPGKKKALCTANAHITKTLRPCRKESVDFDNTGNLFIEGDNLDALKLLKETYLGKVKMIYIDPPYNTGKDFIYSDNFIESAEEYLRSSGQKDEDGNRLVSNKESNGRFHSDWLRMMYPRLKLARNLLRDDGVIFISIDDYEVHNLRKLCDEIFGAENFIANVIWQRAFSPKNDAKYLSENHDYVLIYCKNSEFFEAGRLSRTDEQNNRYKNPDNDSRGVWMSDNLTVKTYSEKYDYPITTPSGRVVNPAHGSCWRVSEEKFQKLIDDNRIWFGTDSGNVPRLKRFLSEVQDGMVATTLWMHKEVGHNQEGRQEVKALFDDKGYFDGPKPVRLLNRILQIANTSEEDIILDFFAGSATTAHAVMQLNAEDNGKRKFIMVQLPEVCDEKSEAFKAGYKTIAEISKERIRRAGKKIKDELIKNTNEEQPTLLEDPNTPSKTDPSSFDIGFRVLKVDSSNMVDVYYTSDSVKQNQLTHLIDNIKDDRTSEDLLFQVLLDWGVDLTLPVTTESIDDHEVFFVDDNALAACFEKNGEITEDFCKELTGRKPLRVVFRDSGFKDDSVKINVGQIFKLMSPHTDVTTI